jgi:hypothetical protein
MIDIGVHKKNEKDNKIKRINPEKSLQVKIPNHILFTLLQRILK